MDIAAVSAFLKDRFDLSPAEAHLVARLMTGKSLRSCAKALGIKYETARTCLKSVFQKTKTRRQAELVMVVIRAMNETNPPPPRASPPARPGSSS
jgi:DNA-binding CsgD family transcriptional regulator